MSVLAVEFVPQGLVCLPEWVMPADIPSPPANPVSPLIEDDPRCPANLVPCKEDQHRPTLLSILQELEEMFQNQDAQRKGDPTWAGKQMQILIRQERQLMIRLAVMYVLEDRGMPENYKEMIVHAAIDGLLNPPE